MAKKPTVPVVTPVTVPVADDVIDTSLQVGAHTEVATLGSFLTNIAGFLTTARRLEDRALDTLDVAKQLRQPTSKDEDEAIVATVRQWTAERREATNHWDARSVVFSLHKRLIAAFQRADRPMEDAIALGTRLHNDWVAAEAQRVRLEEQRKRDAHEALEREARAAELRKLEEAALEAEASSPDLSERERVFVAAFVASSRHGASAGNAARAAGFKNPDATASRLLATPKVIAAFAAHDRAVELRQQAAAVIAKPIVIADVTVQPEVAASADRTTYRAELFDEGAFLAACLAPGNPYRIPARDLLTVKQAELTARARSMGEAINHWPGVRLISNTKIRG